MSFLKKWPKRNTCMLSASHALCYYAYYFSLNSRARKTNRVSKKLQYAKPVSDLRGFGFRTNKIESRTPSFIKFSTFMQVN